MFSHEYMLRRNIHPSGDLPAKVLKNAVHAGHSEEHDKHQDLFSLLRAVSKASPKKEHNHVLAMLTHLANDVLDEKIELIKLSLSEAGVACHALYNSFFLIILSVMFCALTVFLVSLAMTQFLATFFLVSYLDSLWITTAVALMIGLIVRPRLEDAIL
ncbi:hypothetical protein SPRG_18929 [Saprolegnia parasitica CBS 223.65]|uniref:Uncharacterized protein n=1 Tax=Saprolegnia parasitica (strain CBS 223.65) TaxID=695850 RepID=A0A067D7J7_SAPPC|nr:hypothetical protein SPRG_18929 [Saprolegnia parasitica CBS 223.65]KDO34631.1 hypothetical protein SPRG_18929 [Saprolegnia parasitica CBS 223.65]|eukprot:XP_012194806.1 hypothetical protein SPRG_18929 [Saprolegnia parasitica CBS 223.65]